MCVVCLQVIAVLGNVSVQRVAGCILRRESCRTMLPRHAEHDLAGVPSGSQSRCVALVAGVLLEERAQYAVALEILCLRLSCN
jgi:hypothetical protein